MNRIDVYDTEFFGLVNIFTTINTRADHNQYADV